MDLLKREDEFRKTNELLENKTTLLMKEAEEVMNQRHALKLPSITHQHIQTSRVSNSCCKDKIMENIQSGSVSNTGEEELELFHQQCEKHVGKEKVMSFLKTELQMLKDHHGKLLKDYKEMEKSLKKLELQLKETEQMKTKYLKDNSMKEKQLDKCQCLNKDLQAKVDCLDIECKTLKKELEVIKHDQKQADLAKKATETQLKHALENLEKYKSELQQERGKIKEITETGDKNLEDLKENNQILKKQKAQLLEAFHKQMKLIDILKKQKMHLEAAKALQFTEKEFMKALEWGSH
ncbi:testis-expressed protein 9-like isoform X2 [Limulus polyphemus]|uniref:Testis-expressed protein 9-like isoform X2 n=1 Tax=Limulus polyphemus TaxID=6850 RepID=A0ABM1C632_LIMPO|nr:testis-expressed protein 9-like isoform X2 [Limulus polyphemus]